MSASTSVVVLDRVDPRVLFDLGCQVARTGQNGLELFTEAPSYDDVPMYAAVRCAGQEAVVNVWYPARGGRLPRGEGRPRGHASLMFSTGWFSDDLAEEKTWRHHAALVAALGRLLDARSIRWTWRFEDDPWTKGRVPAGRPGTRPWETRS
jgi:hypothetical protein